MDSRSTLTARAARFRREEQRAPPPLPTNRITVSEGKVVTSDKDVALRKLLERKAIAGVPLTADQQRVLSSLGASANQMSSRSLSQLKTAPSRGTMSTSQPKKTDRVRATRATGLLRQPKQDSAISFERRSTIRRKRTSFGGRSATARRSSLRLPLVPLSRRTSAARWRARRRSWRSSSAWCWRRRASVLLECGV